MAGPSISAPCHRSSSGRVITEPSFDHLLIVTGLFLNLSRKFLHITLGLRKIVVRHFAPASLDFTFELVPIALNLVLVHFYSPSFLMPFKNTSNRVTVRSTHATISYSPTFEFEIRLNHLSDSYDAGRQQSENHQNFASPDSKSIQFVRRRCQRTHQK